MVKRDKKQRESEKNKDEGGSVLGVEDRKRREKQKVSQTCTHTTNMLHKTIHTFLVLLTHISLKLNKATPGKRQREMQREQKM